ncbi:MAG: nucleotidyltransferase domain-containing protein [Defluviitaleaceae bacterium]|nr:nucleotidyltransferase domain-containing protein [Defluviitaleaceae bacterium]
MRDDIPNTVIRNCPPHGQVADFLTKFITQFKQLNIQAESIILFGSQARGTATPKSDIDIAVVMRDSLTPRQRGELLCLGEEIDPSHTTNLFFTTRQAIETATDTFDTNKYIRDEGVVLWQS